MIEFSKCVIDPEGKKLIIEAAVKSGEYYEDVYIDSIAIDTEDTFSPTGPSSSPIFTANYEREVEVAALLGEPEGEAQPEVLKELVKDTKNISLELTPKMLNLSSFNDNMFFVYIKATGTPSLEVPCGEDNIYTLAIGVNLSPIYKMSLNYIKELESSCKVTKEFIDMILKFKAFELALKTGNNLVAAKYWTKLFKGKGAAVTFKSCGCNGTY